MLISCLSLITTVLAMSFVDRAGRKPLLYIGSAGMAICLLCLALAIPYHFRQHCTDRAPRESRDTPALNAVVKDSISRLIREN